jgi:hypothetical protein
MKSTRHAILYIAIMLTAGVLVWVGGMMLHSAIQ